MPARKKAPRRKPAAKRLPPRKSNGQFRKRKTGK